jgi:hypothetical protein
MLWSIVESVLFVASAGVLFSGQFRGNRFVVATAGCVALASSWFLGETVLDRLGYFHHGEAATIPHQPSPPTPASQPPRGAPQSKSATIEQIVPPQSVVDIRPVPGTPNLTFLLADWVSWSASDINVATWISENGNFEKVSSQRYNYLGVGDHITLTEPLTSGARAAVAICVSYSVNDHRVEVIQFFFNQDGSGYRRARDNLFEVDGNGKLCESMPTPARRALEQ